MKASVIIPVHNKAPWLRESIGSVLGQSFSDFELICVDDRSTDDSLEVLRAIDDPRLRVIALERNLGPAGAAQRATDAAIGEYVVRMDADDIMMPDRIESQVAFMESNPAIGASGSHQAVLGREHEIMRASLTDAECRAGIFFQIPMFQPTTIYRRGILVGHGIRFEDDWPRYGEDWWYQSRLLRVTQLANIDRPLLRYRVGDQNMRTGRDRSADLKLLYGWLFDAYGWPIDEEGMRAHFHAVKWFPRPLGADDVRAVAAHLQRLRRLNAERGTFPEPGFSERLDRMWHELGFRLPAFGWSAMRAYMRERMPPPAQLRYMLTSWITGRA